MINDNLITPSKQINTTQLNSNEDKEDYNHDVKNKQKITKQYQQSLIYPSSGFVLCSQYKRSMDNQSKQQNIGSEISKQELIIQDLNDSEDEVKEDGDIDDEVKLVAELDERYIFLPEGQRENYLFFLIKFVIGNENPDEIISIKGNRKRKEQQKQGKQKKKQQNLIEETIDEQSGQDEDDDDDEEEKDKIEMKGNKVIIEKENSAFASVGNIEKKLSQKRMNIKLIKNNNKDEQAESEENDEESFITIPFNSYAFDNDQNQSVQTVGKDKGHQQQQLTLQKQLNSESRPIFNQAIIFCNKRRTVERLALFLEQMHKYEMKQINKLNKSFIQSSSQQSSSSLFMTLLSSIGTLHGGQDMFMRMETLRKFKAGSLSILLTTDVASRGLDIPSVRLVVNYDLPLQPNTYIHRVGRTARLGKKGSSISFITQNDIESVHRIEALTKKQMKSIGEINDKLIKHDLLTVETNKSVAAVLFSETELGKQSRKEKQERMEKFKWKGDDRRREKEKQQGKQQQQENKEDKSGIQTDFNPNMKVKRKREDHQDVIEQKNLQNGIQDQDASKRKRRRIE